MGMVEDIRDTPNKPVHACSSLGKPIQACSSVFKCVQACSSPFKHLQACSSLCKPGQQPTKVNNNLKKVNTVKKKFKNGFKKQQTTVKNGQYCQKLVKSGQKLSNMVKNGQQHFLVKFSFEKPHLRKFFFCHFACLCTPKMYNTAQPFSEVLVTELVTCDKM